jgi:hypothetical protein
MILSFLRLIILIGRKIMARSKRKHIRKRQIWAVKLQRKKDRKKQEAKALNG